MTFGEGPGAQTPWGVMESRDHSAWPCWSPDGRWLSCFQTQVGSQGDGTVWLSVMEAEGVEEQRLSVIDDSIPIYTQWAPDSTRLAVLSQGESHLSLGVCALGELGEYRLMEEGIPLFFSWTLDAQRLLIHSGSAGDTRLMLRDVCGSEPDEVFRKSPGNFCAPSWSGIKRSLSAGTRHGVLCVGLGRYAHRGHYRNRGLGRGRGLGLWPLPRVQRCTPGESSAIPRALDCGSRDGQGQQDQR